MNANPVQAEPSATPSEPVDRRVEEHRGPCPALNALANEGYLPRSGRVTTDQLVHALHERLGIAESVGTLLARAAMAKLGVPGEDGTRVLDLADLGQHGFIEHDASLTRRDAREGDAVSLCPELLDQLLANSADGETLTLEDLATAHQLRLKQSGEGGHRVPLKAAVLGTFEAALLYQVLRGSGAVALTEAREFLGSERVPASVGSRGIGWGTLLLTAVRIAILGNAPFSLAKQRAADAAAAAPTCSFAHGAHGAPRTAG
jgi:hypothetical protein